ncbi:MAG: hypothetical protein KY475_00630 [Planctomycetes bacterium]|nr:hypothetical protein [Planctomycetota bacterium]
MTANLGKLALAAMVGLTAATAGRAAPPWELLFPFKRVDADSNNPYYLSKENGPWLILVASFSGDTAEQQARDLVLELRSRFNVSAYVHKQTYDFTQPVTGLGYDEFGRPKQMKYRTSARFDSVAVLVGDFPSVEDPNLEKALEKLKYAHPQCLDIQKRQDSTQRFAGLRDFYRRVSNDPEQHKKGPMGNAFATRNPLLPEEYFVAGGLDQFVVDMNKDLEFSLLDCPGRYSVRIATFRGQGTMDLNKMAMMDVSDALDKAADKAHKLTLALRKQNVEAYEFHDRHESVVTVGSFDSVGTPRADGKIDLNPAVHQIMQAYGADRAPLPGAGAQLGLRPKSINGIVLDAQPLPVETPKASIGAAYSNGNRQFGF